jgi:hypothetical protein
MTEEIKASEPAQAWTAADFTKELLTGTRQNGLHWSTIEDLFQQAMDAGARHYTTDVQRWHDQAQAEIDATARVIGDFMLVPPDGGDLKLHEGAQALRDALDAAEARISGLEYDLSNPL